jgi:predicted signal transduction protein with EAL and GGDEF domain
MHTVAEGVDSEEQANTLRLFRCDPMQGYLFSRPVPMDEIAARLCFDGRFQSASSGGAQPRKPMITVVVLA